MLKVIIAALLLIFKVALSWAVNVAIVYLITRCFHVGYSLEMATGVWLALTLFSLNGFTRAKPKD